MTGADRLTNKNSRWLLLSVSLLLLQNMFPACDRESASLFATREPVMEPVCRLQSDPWLLAWLVTRGDICNDSLSHLLPSDHRSFIFWPVWGPPRVTDACLQLLLYFQMFYLHTILYHHSLLSHHQSRCSHLKQTTPNNILLQLIAKGNWGI